MAENAIAAPQAAGGLAVGAVNGAGIGSAPIVPQKKKRFKRDDTHVLSSHAKVYSLAVKCYAEQLPNGEQYFVDSVRGSDPKLVQVMAIKHTRCIVTDGIWLAANVKPHWHVVLRFVDKSKRMRVLQLLSMLGIHFRQGVDDELWKERGVETIGNFPGYALYLTHETPEAIREAKELYDRHDVVSNLSFEECEQIREGYIRVSEKRKVDFDELVALDREAYDLGRNLKDFEDWFGNLPFSVRKHCAVRTIRDSYSRGVRERLAEREPIDRLCVFIRGEPNSGKTYGAGVALRGMGLRVLEVNAGGTGKLDNLTAGHDAILIDDGTCPNLLNMCDGYACQPYRRNRDNPPWVGKYFVVTSNDSFPDWVMKCGIKIATPCYDGSFKVSKHMDAMRTRFIICEVVPDGNGASRLRVVPGGVDLRGDVARQNRLLDMFRAFRKRFDAVIGTYRPGMHQPDLTGIYD